MPRETPCVHCGKMTPVGNSRGEGAKAGKKMKKLTELRLDGLKTLASMSAISPQSGKLSRDVAREINRVREREKRNLVTSHEVGQVLSVMAGRGLTASTMGKIKIYSKKAMEWKWVDKPVWWITPAGLTTLQTGVLPPVDENEAEATA